MKVSDIYSRETIVAHMQDTVKDAAALMLRYNVGSLIVAEDDSTGKKPVGMITDRDIVLKVIAPGLLPSETLTKDVMSTKLIVALESDELFDTLLRMRTKIIRRLPVVDEKGYLKGLLTIDDILEFYSKELVSMVSFFKDKSK